MKHVILVAWMVYGIAACSGSTISSGAPSTRADRAVLTIEDIQRTGAVDAFTAVQALRPQWLSNRGSTSFRQSEHVKVYLDGSLMGGPEHLKQIATTSIETIKHMDGLEATQRYGLDHGQGAVLVFTKKGR